MRDEPLGDKVVILHGLRRCCEIRRELRQEGQRISRHHYDSHCLLTSDVAAAADNRALGEDCVRHARMFFDRPDFELAAARPGGFALAPDGDRVERLRRDYAAMAAMIFGSPPDFGTVLASITELEARLNADPA